MGKIRERIIAYILVFCTLVSAICTGITMPVWAEEDTGSINLHTAKVRIYNKNTGQWVDLDEMTDAVEDGDRLSISFDWTLLNVQHDVKEYKVKLPQLKNVIIPDIGPQELLYGSTPIGTFKIEKGVLIIDITESWYLDEMGERYGGVTVEGEIAVNGGFEQDGKRVPVKIGDYEGEVTYKTSATESGLNVSKSAEGTVEKGSDGKYRQTFQVSLKPYGEYITINSLMDELRDGLGQGSMSDWTVVACPSENSELSDLKLGGAYSLDVLNEMLAGKKLYDGETLIFEYTVEVSEDIYKQDGGGKDYKNYFSIDYTTNAGNSKTGQDDAAASANRPTIKKSGEINEDDQTVEWTITIDLKDWKDKTIDEVIDELGSGFKEKNIPLSKENFHETSDGSGIWVATYTTHISEEVQNSPSSTILKNKVTVTVGGNEYTAEASVASKETTWIQKAAIGYDTDKKLITWEVTLLVPDTEVKNVSVKDIPNTNGLGQHTLQTTAIWVDGELVVENGQKVASDEIIKDYNNYYGIYIVFNDIYIQKHAGQSIKITYTTLVEDDVNAGKVYKNEAQLSYFDATVGPEGGNVSQSTEADWKHEVERDVLDKEGEPKPSENAIEYTLKINIDDIQDLAEGGEIVIIDELPDGLKLDENSVKFIDYALYPEWNTENQIYPENFGSRATTGDHEGTEGTIKFTIPVTAYTLLNREQLAGDAWGFYYIYITYKATVKDPSALIRNGGASYTNKATATYNEKKVGSAENETELRPKQVVTKKGEYSKETAPYIYYTIEVNPDALDLSDGWLIAKDTLGSALNYDLDSIVVEKKSADGYSWEKLIVGTNYTYSYNASENSVSFRLPDGEYLKITYRAFVNLTYTSDGALTKENSFNHFELSGFGFPEAESKKDFDKSEIFQPAGWAAGTTGSVTIQKYWTYDDQMVKLNGATFKLSMVVGNDTTSSPMPLQTVDGYESFTIGSNEAIGMKTIDGLRLDQIYVLEEISAPEGFAVGEPYYFVLTGSDNVTLPDGLNGKNCAVKDDIIYYENFPGEPDPEPELGSLTIQKTVAGDLDWAGAITGKGTWSFEVYDSEETLVDGSSISGAAFIDFVDEEGNVRSYTITGLKPDTYTVIETVESPNGYTCSTSYTLVVGEDGEKSNEASVKVTAGENTTVYFTNTYAQKPGSLKILKTVEGLEWDEEFAKTLKFQITANDGHQVVPPWIMGAQFTYSEEDHAFVYTIENLEPGGYTIAEFADGPKGYIRTTTYIVNEEGVAKPGEAADVTIDRDQQSTVAFHNKYELGTLEITKTISGIDEVTEEIKGTITFIITDDTGEEVGRYTLSQFRPGSNPGEYSLKIENLLVGTYTVEEIYVVGGYTAKTVTYQINNGQVEYLVNEKTSTETESAQVTISKEEKKAKIDYVDVYEATPTKGSLTIQKTISGDLVQDTDLVKKVIEGISFKVEKEGGTVIGDSYTLTETGGIYSCTINELDPGKYTVTETVTDPTGYTRSTSWEVTVGGTNKGPDKSATVSVAAGVNTTVEFCNEYTKDLGSLKIIKNVSGDLSPTDVENLLKAISFTVERDGKLIGPYKLTKQEDGEYSRIITGLEPGDYTVTETVKDPSGYTRTTTYTVQVGEDGPTTDSAADEDPTDATVKVEKDKESTITFNNNYKQQLGTLVITKTISGDLEVTGEVEGTIKFVVTNTDTQETKEYTHTLSQFNKDSESGIYTWTLEGLPVGTYTVEETVYTIEGYTATVTYQIKNGVDGTLVDEGIPQEKLAVEVEVTDGGVSQIDYVDAYAAILYDTGLEIQKTVSGDLVWDQVKGNLKFIVYKVVENERQIYGEYYAGSFMQEGQAYVLKLTGLEPGEYIVEETFIADNEPGGYTRTTTYTLGAGTIGSVAKTEASVTVEEKKPSTVIISNDYELDTGTLVLTKAVEGLIAQGDAEVIKFTITRNGGGYTETFTLGNDKFPYNEADKVYKLVLNNLPVGTYTIRETVYNVDGYVIKTLTYQIDNDETALIDNYQQTGKKAPEVTIEKGKTVEVDFYDLYELGSLILEKTVEGGLDWDDMQIFFTITGPSFPTGKDFTAADFTDDDGNGTYTCIIRNLKLGTYTVAERLYDKDPKGYTRTTGYKVNAEDTVTGNLTAHVALTADDKDGKVTFFNSYVRDKGSLQLTKKVTGLSREELQAAIQHGKIKFVITGEGDPLTYTLSNDNFKENPEGTFTLTIENLPTGEYTIEESEYTLDDYQAGIQYAVQVGQGVISTGPGTEAHFEVERGITTQVTYTNDYEDTRGKLVIQKIITNSDPNETPITWNAVKDSLSFVIKDESGKTVKTVSPKTDRFDVADDSNTYYCIVEGLDIDKTYTVTESLPSVNVQGYDHVEVYYTVKSGDDILSGDRTSTATVTVSAEGLVVTFTNKYKEAPSQKPAPSQPQPQQPAQSPAPSPGIQLQVDPTPTPKPAYEDGSVLSAERDRVPKTGDYFSMWLALFLVSLSGLVSYLLYLEKKNREE